MLIRKTLGSTPQDKQTRTPGVGTREQALLTSSPADTKSHLVLRTTGPGHQGTEIMTQETRLTYYLHSCFIEGWTEVSERQPPSATQISRTIRRLCHHSAHFAVRVIAWILSYASICNRSSFAVSTVINNNERLFCTQFQQ